MIPVGELVALPLYHRQTIPKDYLDDMGHMNIRWYMALYDEAAWNFFASFGMDREYFEKEHNGGFALKQFIQYRAEVSAGETVALRTRILGRSAKRIHFILFMINETQGNLASTMEVIGTHADLKIRRTTPFPPHIAAQIDAALDKCHKLDWEAPVCGILRA